MALTERRWLLFERLEGFQEFRASLHIYAEGASVRASYTLEGEQKLARSVEILPGAPQQ